MQVSLSYFPMFLDFKFYKTGILWLTIHTYVCVLSGVAQVTGTVMKAITEKTLAATTFNINTEGMSPAEIEFYTKQAEENIAENADAARKRVIAGICTLAVYLNNKASSKSDYTYKWICIFQQTGSRN